MIVVLLEIAALVNRDRGSRRQDEKEVIEKRKAGKERI